MFAIYKNMGRGVWTHLERKRRQSATVLLLYYEQARAKLLHYVVVNKKLKEVEEGEINWSLLREGPSEGPR